LVDTESNMGTSATIFLAINVVVLPHNIVIVHVGILFVCIIVFDVVTLVITALLAWLVVNAETREHRPFKQSTPIKDQSLAYIPLEERS